MGKKTPFFCVLTHGIFIDLYAYDGDGPVPRLTTDLSIQKVGHFPIRMPELNGIKPGDKVDLTIRMYFGLTEIKIESTIQDKTFVFTSTFDASDTFSKSGVTTPLINQNTSTEILPGSNFYPSPSFLANGYPSQQHLYNNSIPNLGHNTSINNHDFYALPQHSQNSTSYTSQQRHIYPSQRYYDHTNNNSDY